MILTLRLGHTCAVVYSTYKLSIHQEELSIWFSLVNLVK